MLKMKEQITYLTAFRIVFGLFFYCFFFFFLEGNLSHLVYWVNDSLVLKLSRKVCQLLGKLSASLLYAQFALFQNTLLHVGISTSQSIQVQVLHSCVLK